MTTPPQINAPTTPRLFAGVTSPNTTQVPDQYLDELLPELTGAELKVLLYITRRTFGFKKSSDEISLSQLLTGITTRDGKVLDRGTGLSKKTLLQAIRRLVTRGVIVTERRQSVARGYEPTRYRLHICTPVPVTEASPPLAEKVPQGDGEQTAPRAWGTNSPRQQTGKHQTDGNLSNNRKPSVAHGREDRPTNGTVARIVERSGAGAPRAHPCRDDATGMTTLASEIARRQAGQSERRGATAPEPEGPRHASAPRPRVSWPRRVAPHDELYQVIQASIAEFRRELNDRAPLRSSTSRAYNLFKRSGLSREAFLDRMYQSRALTNERAASGRRVAGTDGMGLPVKARMAFFFAVLEDQLGLREATAEPSQGAGSAPDASTPQRR